MSDHVHSQQAHPLVRVSWHMGGGESIEAFRAAGLVDRLELRVIPVLLGDGVPLFPRHARGDERWKLTNNRAFKNGVVELWYERPATA